MTCDPAAQLERLEARGTSADDARQRIDAQAGLADRLRPSSTRVVDTTGTEAATRAAWTPRSTRRSPPGPEA